ncbi:SusC/RagA family TonB-linked outer membrane protein [Pseudoflavitalea sp. G-6-1-2]|uniref:SusC/RagA family TonB-linked outer membrane protein n=1 Tax=Pseudoflavitalea sp. G-6-1-2 TaxID=2728841 RepID=UPI00146CB132|nr:SusC/RagA family TonB-linked outer membrane protein [Pseudoflavitalea sp. G-6-1-2]NML22732.1 SusC/RagA family TonB-linked outer membrane protein [Pseudoflavitalea sp. G-6-1-2]
MQKTAYGCLHFPALQGSRLPAQISKVMRLLPIFLLAALISAHASGSAQSVSISGKEMTLKQVFAEIEKQTGYVFFSNKEMLADARKISIAAVNKPLKDVLNKVLENQGLEFLIQGKTIILSRKPVVPAIPGLTVEQPLSLIAGRVTDTDGTPMAAVNIQIKGSSKGVVSAANGTFTIQANAGDVLVFSFVGYTPREITVTASMISDKQNAFTVALTPSSTKLEEVAVTVNTGYQTISRERMTGAYSSVATKRLENKLQPNLLSALEGQAAGVAVTKDGKLEVRGRSTFLANAEPLVVIDGYPAPGGLESVNIDNIESINILKDAVAASIYGARSSNGVIVITTKTAKKGKLQIAYKGSTGVTLRPKLSYLNKTSASDYVDAEIDWYYSDPANVEYDYESNAVYGRVTQLLIMKEYGQMTEEEVNAELDQLRKNNTLGQLERHLFRNKFTQQHNLTLSTATDKNATNVALRYIANDNNMKGNSDNRLILDLRNDWKPINGVTVKLFTNINFYNTHSPMNGDEMLDFTTWSNMRPYYNLVDPSGRSRNVPAVRPEMIDLYNEYGGLKSMSFDPLKDLTLSTIRNQNLLTRLGASITVNLADGLTGEVGGSWTRGSGTSRSLRDGNAFFVRSLYNATASMSTPGKHYIPEGSMINETRSLNEAYTLRAQANYAKTFNGVHRISVIAGGELNKDVLDNNTAPTRVGYNDQAGTFTPFNYVEYNSGLTSPDFIFPDGWMSVLNGSYSFRDNRFVSVYSNGSYEYDNRFIVSGSIRIDQANLFGTNPKYRYRPNWSVGGTYKLGQEKFFNVSWIDKLNIRGSYGINGNISLSQGPFLLVTSGGYSPISGATPYTISSVPDNNLRWERTLISNFGTDLSLFGGKLNVTLDYYNKLSKDLLAPDFIDPTYGRFTLNRNAGTARNTGIEISLETELMKQKDFSWSVLFNGSYNNSKVIQFNYDYLNPNFLTFSNSPTILGSSGGAVLKTGYPLDGVFSYRFAGLDNTGTPMYYTAEGKKTLINNIAVKDMTYSGTMRPKYILSITNSLSYQQFDLSFMVISQLGGIFRRDGFSGDNIDQKDVAKRWRKPGDEEHTIYPKLSAFSSDGWYFPFSDAMIESSDFVKLRDVTLSYRIDNKVWGKTGLNNARVFFQGRNLVSITANKVGVDPETIAVGLNATINRTLPLRPEFYVGFSVNL